jgi:hypothetical protein
LYAANAALPICRCASFRKGFHYADLEHVTVKLFMTPRGDALFQEMYTARHNGGVWVHPFETIFEDNTHPVVFSSWGAHATYNKPGTCNRYLGVVQDVCTYGVRWQADKLVMIRDNMQDMPMDYQWTGFKGNLGDGHVSCFQSQSWWSTTETNKAYGKWF